MKLALIPLGRSTFDVAFANEKFNQMLSILKKTGHELLGGTELLFDLDQAKKAIQSLSKESPDQILILQVTFTDAMAAIEVANQFDQPISIWATPEPRIGGRLRLNAFCGLNLASHALSRNNRKFGYLYADPAQNHTEQMVGELLAGKRVAISGQDKIDSIQASRSEGNAESGKWLLDQLNQMKIGRIGLPPGGFDTCDYDEAILKETFPIEVKQFDLNGFFELAKSIPNEDIAKIRDQADQLLEGLDEVNQTELDKSLRIKGALDSLQKQHKFDSFAIRCWPESFTEYGGATCGPMAMMGEAKIPCACEADVYGSISQLLLMKAANQPVFMVDMVDLDQSDDSCVVWHCGQAPISMANKERAHPRATIHTNRKMPLLFEFPLKPGKVTFVRLSRGHGKLQLVIAEGEMLDRDMAFTGTSGVVRFSNGAETMLTKLMDTGMEHHMALTYGEWSQQLIDFAAAAKIPVTHLTH